MKYLEIYKTIGLNDKDSVFEYILDNLQPTVNDWTYFVNWNKAFKNLKDVEINLNIMNYLIGKDDIEKEFRYLADKYPDILNLLPILIAFRDSKVTLLDSIKEDNLIYINFKFSKMSIDDAVLFCRNSGIFELLKSNKINNLVDYVLGVEVGLDSNGRKNRSGIAMQDIVERFISQICTKHSFSYLSQATSGKIRLHWNVNINVDKTNRAFDFAINTGKFIYLIETNYYSGGGSKLKSTAGEYKSLNDLSTSDKTKFIWITEGKGWETCINAIRETFEHIDYILNLKLITDGVFEYIIKNNI